MNTDRTVCDALEVAARTPAGITFIEHDGRTLSLSYRDLLDRACLIGGSLTARGLRAGDRVALVLPETHEFVQAFYGISAAGLVPVPLCPPAQAGDVPTFTRQSRDVMSAAHTAAVITSADLAPLLAAAGDEEPTGRVLVFESLLTGPALDRPIPLPMEATALLQFTSGSTAAPKGVVLSHRNIQANVMAIIAGLRIVPTDVSVSWLPLYHDMGLIGILIGGIYATVSAVLLSPVLFLKRPTKWLEAISTYRGTIAFAPNFAYDLCRRRVKPSQIAALDLSSWRVAGCGAEPIRSDSLRAFADHFASAGFKLSSFVPSYGLAEHSVAVTFSLQGLREDSVDAERLVRESRAVPVHNGSPAVRLVGCGRPFPGHALKIVDDDFRELAERHVGSIVVRGPSVMEEYFEDAAATGEALDGGWLHTGDLGYLADGELYVCGRTKDLIIRQGRKYHPPDLESAIADAGGIRLSGVVVFGIGHLSDEDEVIAVLEARAGARADDIADHARRRVRETAGLELDRVLVTAPGTIPRTTSGKVRRAETRARYEAGTLQKSADTAAIR